MKKLKIKLQKVINNIKILNNKEKKTIFLVTIITSMIVHFQLYALIITGPDTLINSIYHQADIWEPMLLRLTRFYANDKGKYCFTNVSNINK